MNTSNDHINNPRENNKNMVKNEVRGDIFATSDKHIIFAINTEGYNDSGFAGAVSRKCWPELANTGGNKLGEVLTKKSGDKTFYAIVCHSLQAKNGWGDSPQIIEKAINEMQFPETENASIVAIGAGMIGIMSGAPTVKIYEAFKKCKKNLSVYML